MINDDVTKTSNDVTDAIFGPVASIIGDIAASVRDAISQALENAYEQGRQKAFEEATDIAEQYQRPEDIAALIREKAQAEL